MTTFFGILFILLSINAILLVFSVNRASNKSKKPAGSIPTPMITKIYPLDLSVSKYKKAI